MPGKILQPAIGQPEPPPRRLSEDLHDLLRETRGHAITIGELEQILKGRGFALFLLLFSLPFAFPIPVPGLSVPFGIVITILGSRIMLGMKPSLPGFIMRRELSPGLLEKTVGFGLKLSRLMEKVVRPRMNFLQRWPGMINLIGLAITSNGLLLSLPLPIPFSNSIPAISVILLTAGLMERDGLLVLLGHVLHIVAWVYVFFTFRGAIYLAGKVWMHFGW